MLDLIIMIVAFSKLHMLNGWILALMIIKALWEVIKLMIVSAKVGSENS